MAFFDVLIVGAGHAGAQLAISLRQMGYVGSVAMIGDEAYPPYERPPLSKEFLSGDKVFERILIRPENFWKEKDIEWIGNQRIVEIDSSLRQVTAHSGKLFSYGKLVWAAGGAARRLAMTGGNASNVHVVRNRADVDAIMADLKNVKHVTIVGGGYIGLEAAAVLRKFGKAVTLLEAAPRVLSRVAAEPLSRFYEQEHRRQGVMLRLNAQIVTLNKVAGRIVSVDLDDGERVITDMLIVGIGIDPEVRPLAAAGALTGNGVKVDALCRTSINDIYAIGDCAAHANRFAQGHEVRIESVQNANDQAKTVAAHLMGMEQPYDAIPWFWSNQYDLKLQSIGLSMEHDATVLRGDLASRSFSLLYLREDRLIAIDAVNAVKDYVQAKQLILNGWRLDVTLLADPSIPLKQVGALACE